MLPRPMTEMIAHDADEMRTFYQSVGISPEIIERAIEVKFRPSMPDGRETPKRGRPRRGASASEK